MADRPSDSPRLLATAMAGATGLDLARAQRSGEMTADEVSDLIQTCRRCTAWQECPSWMNEHGTGAHQAPGYCLNRPHFDDLNRRRFSDGF